ncbi:hypothetical protein ACJX0J_026993, partial [Zea mays]
MGSNPILDIFFMFLCRFFTVSDARFDWTSILACFSDSSHVSLRSWHVFQIHLMFLCRFLHFHWLDSILIGHRSWH